MEDSLDTKINVVHLVDDLKLGGLEKTLAIIVKNLDMSRYRVSIWCLISGGRIAEELKEKGVEVKILRFSISAKIRSLIRLTWRLKKEKIDILHCWGISGGVWGRCAAILAGVPIKFAHVQNLYYDLSRKARLIERLLSIFTDKVIACSETVSRCLIGFIGIQEHKIETIYNSVEIEKFSKIQDVQDIRREFNLSKEDIIIGTVSRLVPVKGHIYLLKSAVKVVKDFPRAKFLIIGEGPLKEELQNKATELGIKNNVIFTGLREDIPRLLSVMNIFIQPSIIKEGLPLAIAEACACTLAVIASDIGGNSEVVRDKETGLLVPPADVDALSKSLIFLLQDYQKVKQMGQAGRRFCEERLSSETMMQKIHRLYSFYVNKKLKKK